MAREFLNGAVEVGTKPTLICTVPPGVTECTVQSQGDVDVYIGGPSVAVNEGYLLKPNADKTIDTYEHDSTDIYGIVAQGLGRVAYLVSG